MTNAERIPDSGGSAEDAAITAGGGVALAAHQAKKRGGGRTAREATQHLAEPRTIRATATRLDTPDPGSKIPTYDPAKTAEHHGKDIVKAPSKQVAKKTAEKAAVKGARKVGTKLIGRVIGGAVGALGGPAGAVVGSIVIGTVVEAICDKEFRNSLVSLVRGGGPDINQPPQPPGTQWLPLAGDERDEAIGRTDKAMDMLNTRLTNYDPGDHMLWHTEHPDLEKIPEMEQSRQLLMDMANGLSDRAVDIDQFYRGRADDGDGQKWKQQTYAAIGDYLQQLSVLPDTAVAPATDAYTQANRLANDAFQLIRDANVGNREIINQSHGKWLGFIGRGTVQEDQLHAPGEEVRDKAETLKQQVERINELLLEQVKTNIGGGKNDLTTQGWSPSPEGPNEESPDGGEPPKDDPGQTSPHEGDVPPSTPSAPGIIPGPGGGGGGHVGGPTGPIGGGDSGYTTYDDAHSTDPKDDTDWSPDEIDRRDTNPGDTGDEDTDKDTDDTSTDSKEKPDDTFGDKSSDPQGGADAGDTLNGGDGLDDREDTNPLDGTDGNGTFDTHDDEGLAGDTDEESQPPIGGADAGDMLNGGESAGGGLSTTGDGELPEFGTSGTDSEMQPTTDPWGTQTTAYDPSDEIRDSLLPDDPDFADDTWKGGEESATNSLGTDADSGSGFDSEGPGTDSDKAGIAFDDDGFEAASGEEDTEIPDDEAGQDSSTGGVEAPFEDPADGTDDADADDDKEEDMDSEEELGTDAPAAGGGGDSPAATGGGDGGFESPADGGSDAGGDFQGDETFDPQGGDDGLGEPVDDLGEDDADGDSAEDDEGVAATVGGNEVEFPNEQSADLAEKMEASDGTDSLRDLAQDAGFTPGAVGEDIGVAVPNGELSVGDVMSTDDGDYLYLGEGQALSEDGVTVSTDEIDMSGEHGGIFRMEVDGVDLGDELGAWGGSDDAAAVDLNDGGADTSSDADVESTSPETGSESETESESASESSQEPSETAERSDEAPIGIGAGQNLPEGGASEAGETGTTDSSDSTSAHSSESTTTDSSEPSESSTESETGDASASESDTAESEEDEPEDDENDVTDPSLDERPGMPPSGNASNRSTVGAGSSGSSTSTPPSVGGEVNPDYV